MRFAFEQIPVAYPVPSLSGRTSRPWPMLFMSVVTSTATVPFEARVDSGSDETILDELVAVAAGIDLSTAPTRTCFGIAQGACTVRFAQVKLRPTDGIEFREWPAWVGFVAGLRCPVLGFGGFLQFFTTTLFGDDEAMELTNNRLYPGT